MINTLDWSSNVIFGFLSVGLAYIPSLIVMLRIYARWKARYVALWASIIILIAGYTISSALGSIYSIDMMGTVGTIFLLSGNFLILVFIDSVNRDSVSPLKIGVISILWGVTSINYILSLTESIFQAAISQNMLYLIISVFCAAAIFFLPGLLVVYHCFRILRHVPRSMKFYTILFLTGGFLIFFASVTAIADIRLPDDSIVGGLNVSGFFTIAAIVCITFAISKQPQLAYILPFKVLRLSVVNTNSGVPIFTHDWQFGQKQVDEILFSGMLQGISVILKESVDRGNVREISLDEGIMIIQQGKIDNVAYVLVATKSSRMLRDSLRLFSERFHAQYSQYFVDPINKALFEPASELVSECFPFIPS
ncbi:MAG: hypothetical protein ACFFCS_21445 [Candidatus Hodarchaeota archaeon]